MSAYRPTFLSHAHADNALCDRYAAALQARGIPLWYDRSNAQTGHFLGDEIQRELERRSAFVVLLTQHALESFWVKLETQTCLGLMAKDRSRMLLPVRIGPCDVPAMLNAFLWVDTLALSFEAAIDAIATALVMHDVSATSTDSTPQPHTLPQQPTLPEQPGPAPSPAGATPALHLTPMSLYSLGFRGWNVNGVEFLLPPICSIPGGVFTMGSDKTQDEDVEEDEMPQYPVLVGDFSIGQHPVTVAEYACAVRAKGVRVPSDGGGGTTWEKQLQQRDHPVVCVSWHDAVAYAAWLAQMSGQPWRLPTEAEWEKMARWDVQAGQSRRYPWGDTFDKTKCNTDESGIGATTPVGRYPGGASPCGAQDVAGNVWEWTSSLDKPYPYNQRDGRENPYSIDAEKPMLRLGSHDKLSDDTWMFFSPKLHVTRHVLRGGSWHSDAWAARSACRWTLGTFWLNDLDNDSGFRLALTSK